MSQRRLLIATGVTKDLETSAGRLVESVSRMSRLFETTLGYERVTALGLNPTAQRMRDELRAFAKRCTPTDIVVLYHTGHADNVAGRHRLWMGDTADPVADALPTAELTELLLAGTPLANLLLILDTCFAAEGGMEALEAAHRAIEGATGKTAFAIDAAHPKEQVRAGDFAGLFERAVDHPATGAYQPRYLPLDAIVGRIKRDKAKEAWQTVSLSTIYVTHEVGFLPNPRYDSALHGMDVATQLQIVQDEQRRQDMEKFFARSRENFVGRHAALREITAWLTAETDMRTIVVTGDPGSGKSAVIGQLSALSDPDWEKTVSRQSLPPGTVPPPGSITASIHARNRTTAEILQALCASAQVAGAATAGEFLQARAGKPMVAAIDAIDEAVDLDRLVAVLNSLIDAGPRMGFRMLLGTRSHVLGRLSAAINVINLDDPKYADPDSLREYAEGRLRSVEGSPYAAADPRIVRAVARAVAGAAGRSFLVALITSRSLAMQPAVADPGDQAWLASLPGTAADAMEQDLQARLGQDAARACDLLRPLAYARGKGLPWEDIWAPLASVLAGRRYSDADLIWLRRTAGSYFVESVEAGRSAYSLYHEALAEFLRRAQADRRVHHEFVTLLLDRVPQGAQGERAWPAAHPYITRHLATHAAEAGELGKLVVDPVYLATADPLGLFAAFATARDPQTRLIGAAYERTMHRLRSSDLADKLSYLELAARRTRATGMAERIAACDIPRRWSVRWLQWPPDYPHRVLAGHHGPVREVVGVPWRERSAQAASVGDDRTLRLWDLGVAEPVAVHESPASLAAIDLVEMPGAPPVAVVLSASGLLTTHDLPSLSRVLEVPVTSGWGAWGAVQLLAHEMRCIRLPDGRWAAITAGPGLTTSIWDLEAGQAVVRLRSGLRPACVEFRTLASGDPVVVSGDTRLGAEDVFDLRTGRRIPDIRTAFRGGELAYYCRADGTPVLGLLSRAFAARPRRMTLFDLTGPAGRTVTGQVLGPDGHAQLLDGSRVRLAYDVVWGRWRAEADGPGDGRLVRLSDTTRRNSEPAAVTQAKHAAPSPAFPYTVLLDGRLIDLSPASGGATRAETVVLTGHGAQVTDAATVLATRGTATLVSSSVDGTVRVWDVGPDIETVPGRAVDAAPAVIAAVLPRPDRTLAVAVTPDGDSDAIVLDLATGVPMAQLESFGWPTAACGWLPDIGDVAFSFHGHYAGIWRLRDGAKLGAFRTHLSVDPILAGRSPLQAAFVALPGRPLAITSGHGNKAVVWDLVGRRIHNVLGNHTGHIGALACVTISDGKFLAATGGQDNTVNLWDVVRGRRVGHITIAPSASYMRRRESGHPVAISMVSAERHGLVVLVLCEDGSLGVFSRKSRWQPGFRRTVIETDGATSLTVLPLTSGPTVVLTGGTSGRLSAWDFDALVSGSGGGPRTLADIETETPITGLSAAGDDTVVMSGLHGLAAFRVHRDCLYLDGQASSHATRSKPNPVTTK
jgi:WD40 repeat protein